MGALSMLCFCLGTVPLMLGFSLVSGRLNKRFARPMRVASGALVLLMGMAMEIAVRSIIITGDSDGIIRELAKLSCIDTGYI